MTLTEVVLVLVGLWVGVALGFYVHALMWQGRD